MPSATPQTPYQHPSIRSGGTPEPFFDLSLADHAYLLGLLQTDGCHSETTRNRGRISLELKVEDKPLLEKIQALVPWYSNIRVRTRETNFVDSTTNASWTLCSHDARQELSRLGLPPGPKSRNCKPPDHPDLSTHDYLRGLIDGDGSVGFTSQGYPFVAFSTASEFLIRYVEHEFCNLSGVPRETNRNTRDRQFNVLYTNDPASIIAAKLYSGAHLALGRKRKAAAEVARWKRPASMRGRPRFPPRRWTADEDELATSDRPVSEIAAQLHRSQAAVTTRRWRLREQRQRAGEA